MICLKKKRLNNKIKKLVTKLEKYQECKKKKIRND